MSVVAISATIASNTAVECGVAGRIADCYKIVLSVSLWCCHCCCWRCSRDGFFRSTESTAGSTSPAISTTCLRDPVLDQRHYGTLFRGLARIMPVPPAAGNGGGNRDVHGCVSTGCEEPDKTRFAVASADGCRNHGIPRQPMIMRLRDCPMALPSRYDMLQLIMACSPRCTMWIAAGATAAHKRIPIYSRSPDADLFHWYI